MTGVQTCALPIYQATISDALADRSKETKTVKVKVTKPSLDAIKARGKKSEKATQESVTE